MYNPLAIILHFCNFVTFLCGISYFHRDLALPLFFLPPLPHPSEHFLLRCFHLSFSPFSSLPSVPLCLCFTSYRVVPLLVSILFTACKSITRNKNFTDPINYAHFIFITRIHRPHHCDNSLMIKPVPWDTCTPTPPFPPSSGSIPTQYPTALKPELLTGYQILQWWTLQRDTLRKFEGQIGLPLKQWDGINNNIFPGKQQPLPHLPAYPSSIHFKSPSTFIFNDGSGGGGERLG